MSNKIYCDICEAEITAERSFGMFEYIEKKLFAQYKQDIKQETTSAHKDLCEDCLQKVKKALGL